MSDKDDIIAISAAAPAEVSEIDLYQRREKIYTRKIEGFFQRVRLFTGWPLLVGYFALPWINLGDTPAVLFDLPARKFHVLTMTFWPQDFVMLAFLLMIAAFALFTVTAFAGRVWCGYTCPQTVWTAIFMWIEQKFEGSRLQRMKLDQEPMSLAKFRKKTLKHAGWITVALATGITFIGYFTPIRQLVPDLFSGQAGSWATAWSIFFTCATYINAAYMREQVCTYMCPYARFQSAMFDANTLIVSYDAARGEPRGSRRQDAPRDTTQGDCVDCQLCVQVCPTGIDIRDGLQYQCIGCALCIDACNSIMDKMGYDRGLVSYTSENKLQGLTTKILRPRLVGYVTVLLVMVSVFSYTLAARNLLEFNVIRDRNQLFIEQADGSVDNVYTLHIVNKDALEHSVAIEVLDIHADIVGATELLIPGGEMREHSLRLRVLPEALQRPGQDLRFRVTQRDNPEVSAERESRFITPF